MNRDKRHEVAISILKNSSLEKQGSVIYDVNSEHQMLLLVMEKNWQAITASNFDALKLYDIICVYHEPTETKIFFYKVELLELLSMNFINWRTDRDKNRTVVRISIRWYLDEGSMTIKLEGATNSLFVDVAAMQDESFDIFKSNYDGKTNSIFDASRISRRF
jgi:hypothetical protein